MPLVTALREERGRKRVFVDLDGRPWRVFPVDVVVRAELRVGAELDRVRARTLARERRRAEALRIAGRKLRHRELTRRALATGLERAGVPAGARAEAIDALAGAGLVDDDRFAASRAEHMAERGYGNEAVRWDLERRGVAPELAERAVQALEPEAERAARIVATRGEGPATAFYLGRRGFDADVVEAVATAAGNGD